MQRFLRICGLLAGSFLLALTSGPAVTLGQTAPPRPRSTPGQDAKSTGAHSASQKSANTSGNKVPVKFDFTVVSAEQEEALPESTRVEGLAKDDTRLILSCPLGLPRRTPEEIKGLQKETRLASQDAKLPTLSIYGNANSATGSVTSDAAEPAFLVCMIINRVAHAKDVSIVRVISSQPTNSKGARGFQVEVSGTAGSFKLACSLGAPGGKSCAAVKAGNYRAIRYGSDFRLCDVDLNVVGSYKIISESPNA